MDQNARAYYAARVAERGQRLNPNGRAELEDNRRRCQDAARWLQEQRP